MIVTILVGMVVVVRGVHAEYPGAGTKNRWIAKYGSNKAAKHVVHARRHPECIRKWLKGVDCRYQALNYPAFCNDDAQRRFPYPQGRPRLPNAWQPCGSHT